MVQDRKEINPSRLSINKIALSICDNRFLSSLFYFISHMRNNLEIEKLVERKGLRFEDRRLVCLIDCRLNSRFNYRSGIDNGYDHAMRLTGGQESRESGGDRVEAATVAQFAKDPLLSPIFESR